MALQYDIATNEEIVQYCLRSNPGRDVISEFEGGLSVIKISEAAVVKCGFGVTHLEAQNQLQAYEIIDPTIIRIPRVYRFFTHGLAGYIIMEYIKGQPLSSVGDPASYLQAVAHVLKHFEQVLGDKPGPFHGGLAHGQLWLDESIAPATISDIEEYFNQRQLKLLPKLKLASYPLVFCHLDIAPRNIMVLEDGSLCLIDWATAGFYPRLFERCALRLNTRKKDDWNAQLLELLDILDEGEMSQAQLLEQAYYLGQRYTYYLVNAKPKPPPGMRAPAKRERKAARKAR
ncbi:kinase-like domain-containing protein [Phaeosphaeriaceae sp. PMI808]|nr:kinase-like domain-containing protein [Phaeosphaeriaceae sp. PMI808]